jgi:geranylgeranyl pyrophosphate synthase
LAKLRLLRGGRLLESSAGRSKTPTGKNKGFKKMDDQLHLWQSTPNSPMDKVPRTKRQRDDILQIVSEYIASGKLAAPLSMDELKYHSQAIITSSELDSKFRDFIAVVVNNEIWRDTVAAVEYERRLFLLPQCLRDSRNCKAQLDSIGLVCEHCGGCSIDELKSEAEKLGYAVLIAEGSPLVMSLIETGRVEAVVGVSCLEVLEKTFPYMEAGAVPGIAIPLLYDGCKDTAVDVDWVLQALYKNSCGQAFLLNIDELRETVESWFNKDSLLAIAGVMQTDTDRVAFDWLAKAGKRWRPFLAASTYLALTSQEIQDIPDQLKKMAVAVECFHKASLIHDDIEDGDSVRYGEKTLHAEQGVPIAINIGDYLVGQGYRLLSELNADPAQKVKMLKAASAGHLDLCLGQGKELFWINDPKPLSVEQVIDVFKMKTSPAFEVALKLGAILASCEDELFGVIEQYSRALGVAYQINDDIDDFETLGRCYIDRDHMELSVLFTIALEKAHGDDKTFLLDCWLDRSGKIDSFQRLRRIFDELKVIEDAQDLADYYKSQAISALARIDNTALKSLLRKVICKIFNDLETMRCCDDFKAGNDIDRKQGS